ncbi:hypothetical protein QNH48_06665 [Neobacillus sp. YX16]|uniref:hypothetical protein n=1 Tax=Neobacillus sp. YX16 TaxID=3047874 RepID=UPI0024C3F9BC|nr:hypothetical protein [Neobacillus sp. YX16]WHZ04305.1 hypothetical protein QNH48_06665 [Neobacillus sp. YX16]
MDNFVQSVNYLPQRDLPMWLSIIQGLVAAAGLISLILGVVQGSAGLLNHRIDSIPHRCAWRIRVVFLPFTSEDAS